MPSEQAELEAVALVLLGDDERTAARRCKVPVKRVRELVAHPPIDAVRLAVRRFFVGEVRSAISRLGENEEKLEAALAGGRRAAGVAQRYATVRGILQDKVAASMRELEKLEPRTAKPLPRPKFQPTIVTTDPEAANGGGGGG